MYDADAWDRENSECVLTLGRVILACVIAAIAGGLFALAMVID